MVHMTRPGLDVRQMDALFLKFFETMIDVGQRMAVRSILFSPKKEAFMPSFDVRFIKTVCDDSGHEHRACQAEFTIDAASPREAVQRAEADFCQLNRVHDWTMFADAVECRSPAALS